MRYWDQQLLELLEYGFPLDSNRVCTLHHEGVNHSSATQFPRDTETYINEERQYGAIIGPFTKIQLKVHTFHISLRVTNLTLTGVE